MWTFQYQSSRRRTMHPNAHTPARRLIVSAVLLVAPLGVGACSASHDCIDPGGCTSTGQAAPDAAAPQDDSGSKSRSTSSGTVAPDASTHPARPEQTDRTDGGAHAAGENDGSSRREPTRAANDGGAVDVADAAVPAISVAIDPVIRVRQGETADVVVAVSREGGLSGPIDVTILGLPSGVTANPVTLGPLENRSTVTITAAETAPLGGPGRITVVASYYSADRHASLAFAYGDAFVVGAPGALDITFGTSGSVQRHVTNTEEDANDIAIDPKNRIVVVGEGVSTDGTVAGTRFTGWALRLTPRGDTDESFGTGGVLTNFGTPSSSVYTLALVGNSPVVGVNLPGASSVSSYVRKLLESGSNDPHFGSGGNVSLANIGIGGLLRRSTGFLIFDPDFTIRAIDDNGAPQPYQAPDVGFSRDSTPVDSHDRLVYGTSDKAGTTPQIGRLEADGSPDPTFGTGGLVSFAIPGKHSVVLVDRITLDADDGPIAVIESQYGKWYENELDLVRVTNAGIVDRQFGTNGISKVAPAGLGTRTLFTDDGRILVLYRVVEQNETTVDCYLARFESSGGRDATWNSGGDLRLPDCPDHLAYDRVAQRLLLLSGGFGGMKITRLWL